MLDNKEEVSSSLFLTKEDAWGGDEGITASFLISRLMEAVVQVALASTSTE
jgi:hypothetical protein